MKKIPNIPMKHSLRLLVFSYVSAVVIILLLLISGQAIIQWSLAQEAHDRAVVAQVNSQELRTQRMFYDVILLQNPEGHGVDYMAIDRLVLADEPTWETVQQAMYAGNTLIGISPGDFSSLATSTLAKEKPGFLSMEAAYQDIFRLEQKDHPANPDLVRGDVDVIYLGEGPYLESLVTIYSALVVQADQLVTQVRIIELVLFILAILVLCFEAFFVVRPAILRLKEALSVIAEAFQKKGDDPGQTP